ncbi:uncharacterized protein LOC108677961 [Hyalella azteca]|uniref:Uncharacterized protein LOC108677961 n=1 Tax=Hyalella azteca TaxID=294128 RepID=A0A8B7P6H8_HYAAZ|nr:uncharacterized protein LOC108677961 [Hyalella azteca]
MFDFIVKYENRSFLIKVDNKEDLLEATKQRFQEKGLLKSPNCHLECYIEGLNTYCEVECQDLPNTGKLRLVFENDIHAGNSDDERNLSACAAEKSFETNAEYVGTDAATDELPKTSFAKLSEERPQSISNTQHCKWPGVFEVNVFPSTLKEALNAGEALTKKQMTELLDCLYNKITKYTFYPTSANYKAAAVALLARYPQLMKAIKFGDAVEIWRVRISMKARNARQRRDRQVPCVMAMRAKKKLNVSEEENKVIPPKKNLPKNMLAYGVLNYLPTRPVTEDDISIERHRSLMINELKKNSLNPRTIEELMRLTFHDRRRLIITETATVAHVAELYPALFNPNQILFEFQRLTEINLTESLRGEIKKSWRAIHLLSQVAISDQSDLDSDEYEERMIANAFLLIPALMREEITYDMPLEESTLEPAPTLHFRDASVASSEGVILAEGRTICQVSGITEGFLAWFASFYVFNMAYPRFAKKTLCFIQRGLLGLKDNTKTP